MSEPSHFHIADIPLHFKRQEICTGVPRLKFFCILRVLRQTSKGSRPMHSRLQDDSKLDVKLVQEWCTQQLQCETVEEQQFSATRSPRSFW